MTCIPVDSFCSFNQTMIQHGTVTCGDLDMSSIDMLQLMGDRIHNNGAKRIHHHILKCILYGLTSWHDHSLFSYSPIILLELTR